jgi:hypothetical protein
MATWIAFACGVLLGIVVGRFEVRRRLVTILRGQ